MKTIEFTADQVRAAFAGRLTQVRVLMNPQPKHRPILAEHGLTIGADPRRDGAEWFDADCVHPGIPFACPYGHAGLTLRVKEPFFLINGAVIIYAATLPPGIRGACPAAEMNAENSRLSVEATDIQAVRLMQVEPGDAAAEGVEITGEDQDENPRRPELAAMRRAWNAEHGDGAWEEGSLAWAWLVKFRVLSR